MPESLRFKHYFTLSRAAVSLFAAGSAVTGYCIGPSPRSAGVLIPAFAVFLLACGASALNQFQERSIDARMPRTSSRPLPAGLISPGQALLFALITALSGLLILFRAAGPAAAVLGSLALLWYNGCYTYLKRVTAFAAVPGAIVGMAPPAIGWVSAGGSLQDPRLTGICILFFLWQVPHFWLLILRHGGEYAAAGLPSLSGRLTRSQIGRITFAWIVAASAASLGLPLYGSIRSPIAAALFLGLAVWLIWQERGLLLTPERTPVIRPLFTKINIYLLLIMLVLSLEHFLF